MWVPWPVPPFRQIHFRKCSCWHAEVLYLANLCEDNIYTFAKWRGKKTWYFSPTNNKHFIGFVNWHVAKLPESQKVTWPIPALSSVLLIYLLHQSLDVKTDASPMELYTVMIQGVEDEGKEGACRMVWLPAQVKNIEGVLWNIYLQRAFHYFFAPTWGWFTVIH